MWRRIGIWKTLASFLVGACIPLAWWFTKSMTGIAFEPVTIESLSFTGPSADTLMLFLSQPGSMIDFDVGLVPGVFLGAFLAALVTGELELQGFEGGGSMRRYLAGAALMGFGGMLAGGCAVGAGVIRCEHFRAHRLGHPVLDLDRGIGHRLAGRPQAARTAVQGAVLPAHTGPARPYPHHGMSKAAKAGRALRTSGSERDPAWQP